MNAWSNTSCNGKKGPFSKVLSYLVMATAAVMIASCGGSGVGDSDSSLSGTVSETRGEYQIIDLATGTVVQAGTVSDLLSNGAYRTSKLVVRRVAVSNGTVGTGVNDLGAVIDSPNTSASASNYYLSVFEITQAQWKLMTGNEPWLLLTSNDGANDVQIGDTYPAVGLSYDLVTTSLQAFHSASGVNLQLPSDVQWELACRGGGSGVWSWGNTADTATVSAAAIVWETAGTTRGARPVGSLAPNSVGLYDMHGNVWEMTSNTHIRGGSWNDPVTVARAAHKADIDPATRHLLVGARLIYVP